MDRSDANLATPQSGVVLQDCSYRNSSDRMVILRCCGSDQFFLERVVFPFEILAFACPPRSEVKIWSHGLYGPELLESLISEQLLAEGGGEEPAMDGHGMFPSAAGSLQTTPWLRAS